jgi:hypothetical protein
MKYLIATLVLLTGVALADDDDRYIYDGRGHYQGWQQDGNFYDRSGQYRGYENQDGYIYDEHGQYRGYEYPEDSGHFYDRSGHSDGEGDGD